MATTLRPRAERHVRAACAAKRSPPSFLQRNALGLVTFAIFAVLVVAMVLTGHSAYNAEQLEHGSSAVSLGTYLSEGHVWEALFENWESEFLQMGAYVLLTVFLIQKGSAESKDPEKHEAVDDDPREADLRKEVPWPVRRGRPLAAALRELAAHRLRGPLHRVTRGPRPRWRRCAQRRAPRARPADRRHVGLLQQLAVLVRVVPELAERVPRSPRHRRVQRVPPPTRITGEQARRREPLRHRLRLTAFHHHARRMTRSRVSSPTVGAPQKAMVASSSSRSSWSTRAAP